MSIEFYDVYYDGAQLTFDVHDDLSIEILYLNNYFGFKSYLDIEWIKRKQSEGTIVIYDKTHSLFLQNDLYLQVADYAFCSVRKWFAVASGAILSKRNGDFIDFNLRDCGYVQTKLNAQILKSRYLAGDISVSKEMFYPAFADFSHHLEDDYADYKMDGQSISLLKSMNISDIIARRRANAKMLYSELKGINHVQFLFSDLDDDTIPLFVPIIASTQDIREIIRRELIARQIYCPVHWPRNSMISSKLKVNKIYDQEISLICDQRYTPQQLEGIIQTIKNINI